MVPPMNACTQAHARARAQGRQGGEVCVLPALSHTLMRVLSKTHTHATADMESVSMLSITHSASQRSEDAESYRC